MRESIVSWTILEGEGKEEGLWSWVVSSSDTSDQDTPMVGIMEGSEVDVEVDDGA